jgi:hypothetical protein
MTTSKRPPKSRSILRARNLARYRTRALDDAGSDELLDDWMVGCPAAEPVPST